MPELQNLYLAELRLRQMTGAAMREFYKKMESLDQTAENRLFIVLDGPCAGDRLLSENGRPVCSEGTFFSDDFIRDHRQKLEGVEKTGTICLNGTGIYVERIGGLNRMVICGGGHVSVAVTALAKRIGFHVTVLEDRITFADRAKQAGADEVICDGFEHALSGISGDENTWFVVMTRGHRFDQECLLSILKKPAAYVGMMGSRSRSASVRKMLEEEKIDPEKIKALHAPIGLSIGAQTPEEIAVSVLAEIIQIKNDRAKGNGEGFSKELLAGIRDERPKVLATIVSQKGSAPRLPGTRMLVFRDEVIGTVGGGCAEAAVIRKARAMLAGADNDSTVPEIFRSELLPDGPEEDGMACGGIQDVLLEFC